MAKGGAQGEDKGLGGVEGGKVNGQEASSCPTSHASAPRMNSLIIPVVSSGNGPQWPMSATSW